MLRFPRCLPPLARSASRLWLRSERDRVGREQGALLLCSRAGEEARRADWLVAQRSRCVGWLMEQRRDALIGCPAGRSGEEGGERLLFGWREDDAGVARRHR